MEKVTVALIGPFGPPQLACVRSWRRAGIKIAFVHVSAGRKNSLVARLADAYLQLKPDLWENPGSLSLLESFLTENAVRSLVCVSEDTAREIIRFCEKHGNRWEPWVAPVPSIDLLEKKEAQRLLAERCGFQILPTFKTSKQSSELPPAELYPLVARPNRNDAVKSVFKAELIRDADAFRRLQDNLADDPSALIITQPYVGSLGIVVHGYRSPNGEKIGFIAFEVSARLDYLTLVLTPMAMPKGLLEPCTRFAHESGVAGVFHYELLHRATDETYYFLELNGRLGGTTGKVYACGYDEPLALVFAFGGTHGFSVPPPHALRRSINRFAVAKRIVRLARGEALGPFDHPNTTGRFLGLAARSLVMQDELLSWSAPLSTLAHFWDVAMGFSASSRG